MVIHSFLDKGVLRWTTRLTEIERSVKWFSGIKWFFIWNKTATCYRSDDYTTVRITLLTQFNTSQSSNASFNLGQLG